MRRKAVCRGWSLSLVAAAVGLALVVVGRPLEAADRPPVAVDGVPGCADISGRYVAWLRGSEVGLVASSAEFPAAQRVPLDERGALSAAPGFAQSLTVAGADVVWTLRLGAAPGAPEGCLAFDKDRFTWEGDLVSYVRYLGGLLAAAQGLDPSVRTLSVRHRNVALEVGEAGGPKVRLEGPEAAMQGLGRWTDPVRHFFLPVLVGPGEERVLVRILRNQGDPFGARSTEGIGWVLLSPGGEPGISATEPAFELRVVGIE
ncbi:MAG TPA: hypothetical protein VMV46_22595 [Thermoanaerobaculia bacterium]|nr:hypothetical protein [Thermoanaerobaculia bacterium]